METVLVIIRDLICIIRDVIKLAAGGQWRLLSGSLVEDRLSGNCRLSQRKDMYWKTMNGSVKQREVTPSEGEERRNE